MDKVWIIHGETGEYTDSKQWNVAALSNEEDATYLCNYLNDRLNKLRALSRAGHNTHKVYSEDDLREKVTEEMGKLDENFSFDYTGTEYFVTSVKWRNEI